jgi:hypothetical protein
MIEQQARDYFQIAPELRLHPNAWTAAHCAYEREQQARALASRRETEATTLSLAPRKKPPKTARRKVVSSFDYDEGPLKPHFNYGFEGHSATFREEVAVLARKDNGLRPNATISPRRWKAACHKHFVLVESNY